MCIVNDREIQKFWEACGPLDGSETLEDVARDIAKHQIMIAPCREWLSTCRHLKNIRKLPDTLTLKNYAESDLGKFLPHSVFIFAAFLEGFILKPAGKRGDVWVFQTNIGKRAN